MAGYAVFDIDGVLADVRHRLRYVKDHPKDWDLFFGKAEDDPVLDEGLEMVTEARESGLHVVYSTGRPDRCRQATVAWLDAHDFPSAQVFMRSEKDRRPGRVTKLEVARRLRNRQDVEYLVDDDLVVVDALREDGFTVVHATWMHQADGPDEAQAAREAQQILFAAQQEEGRT